MKYPQYQRAANHLQFALIEACEFQPSQVFQETEEDQVRVKVRIKGIEQEICITVGGHSQVDDVSHYFVGWGAGNGEDFMSCSGTSSLYAAMVSFGQTMEFASRWALNNANKAEVVNG